MRAALMRIALIAALGSSTVQAAQHEEQSGKKLFYARCGGCHLEGGGGTHMLAKRLGQEKALLEQRQDLMPLYIRTVVRWGVGSMPWFTRTELPDSELTAITDYLASNAAAR